MGISPRRLNGWEPKQVTENVWDGDRLVRSTVTSEPEWSPDQRDLMLAYDALMADVDPSHGFRRSESTHPDANAPGSGWGFVADPEPIFDQVDIVRAQARENYKRANPEADLTGATFRVRRVGD